MGFRVGNIQNFKSKIHGVDFHESPRICRALPFAAAQEGLWMGHRCLGEVGEFPKIGDPNIVP